MAMKNKEQRDDPIIERELRKKLSNTTQKNGVIGQGKY